MKIGIAGLGYIGEVHLRAAEKIPESRVVACATSRAEEIRQRFPGLRVHPTYQDLLNDADLEAVAICVPTYLHEQYTLAALGKGLHVLCEKPMALEPQAAGNMVAAARSSGRILMIAQVLRFWPQYVRIKQIVESGAIGTVQTVAASRLAKSPPRDTWFHDPAKSGGCLLDLQIHDVDFIHWLLGAPDHVRTYGIQSASGCWDHVFTTLSYPGAIATVEGSFLMPDSRPFTSAIRVAGTKGSIEYEFKVGTNVQDRDEASHHFRLYKAGAESSEPAAETEDAYVAQLRYFSRCVEHGQDPEICSPDESCSVMKVMEASRQSAETGQTLALEL